MLEILKSKLMIGFVLFMAVVCYINCNMNNSDINMEVDVPNQTVVVSSN